jgi:hypothetical protein
MSDFYGLPTHSLSSGPLTFEYLLDAGPRIVRLSYNGSPNLLAEVPQAFWSTPHGDFHIRGGHRLWISPELPETTYEPDDAGVQVRELSNGVELIGPDGAAAGVRKSLRIEFGAVPGTLNLLHTIVNTGSRAVELAPWAISMFRLGGLAILPQPIGNADPHGLLANRNISLWPYAHINDPRVGWGDDFILIKTEAILPPFKMGYFNRHGWLAYWLDGILFRKTFEPFPGMLHPDNNCNTELYCNNEVIELESLGPLTALAPGEAVTHAETWELFPGLDVPFIPATLLGADR